MLALKVVPFVLRVDSKKEIQKGEITWHVIEDWLTALASVKATYFYCLSRCQFQQRQLVYQGSKGVELVVAETVLKTWSYFLSEPIFTDMIHSDLTLMLPSITAHGKPLQIEQSLLLGYCVQTGLPWRCDLWGQALELRGCVCAYRVKAILDLGQCKLIRMLRASPL